MPPINRPVALLAFANPNDQVHLETVRKEIQQVKKELESEGYWEVVVCPNADIHSIRKKFHDCRKKTKPISVFHFAGHADASTLILLDPDGSRTSKRANKQGLAAFLKLQEGLQLVFLNGCSTDGHVDALSRAGIPAVVATSTDINDSAATEFAVQFYRSLSADSSIEDAFAEAESAVLTKEPAGSRKLTIGDRPGEMEAYPWSLTPAQPGAKGTQWKLSEHLHNRTDLFEIKPTFRGTNSRQLIINVTFMPTSLFCPEVPSSQLPLGFRLAHVQTTLKRGYWKHSPRPKVNITPSKCRRFIDISRESVGNRRSRVRVRVESTDKYRTLQGTANVRCAVEAELDLSGTVKVEPQSAGVDQHKVKRPQQILADAVFLRELSKAIEELTDAIGIFRFDQSDLAASSIAGD